MRAVPASLTAALAGDVLTIAKLYHFTRADGFEVTLTNHDQDLTIDADTFSAGAALDAGTTEQAGGLSPSTTGLGGAIASEAFTHDDLISGRWLGARLEVSVCDWTGPTVAMPIWSGVISAIEQRDHGFEIGLEGLESRLGVNIGRRFTRQCDARLGDSRCGVSLIDPRFRAVTAVTSVIDDRTIVVTKPNTLLLERLTNGEAQFTSGPLSGLRFAIAQSSVSNTQLMLTLASPMALVPHVTDAIELTIACDGSLATCRDVFANAINHRGCPHMPGEAASFAGHLSDLSAGQA